MKEKRNKEKESNKIGVKLVNTLQVIKNKDKKKKNQQKTEEKTTLKQQSAMY